MIGALEVDEAVQPILQDVDRHRDRFPVDGAVRHVEDSADLPRVEGLQEVQEADGAADEEAVVVLHADRHAVALERWQQGVELPLQPGDRADVAEVHVDRRHDPDQRHAGVSAGGDRRRVGDARDAQDAQAALAEDAGGVLEAGRGGFRRHLVAGAHGELDAVDAEGGDLVGELGQRVGPGLGEDRDHGVGQGSAFR